MRFNELHENIPYVTGGKQKLLTYRPYPSIELAMPGRHAQDTDPVGGDFVVRVTDSKWLNHEFTHTDIFKDVELKATQGAYQNLMQKDAKALTLQLMQSYFDVVVNNAAVESVGSIEFDYLSGIRASTFLQAVQCLAVAEHRRYARFENKFGGRFLPMRFAAGIAEGLWTAADAAGMQKKGRPGTEMLEKFNGTPELTKALTSPVMV